MKNNIGMDPRELKGFCWRLSTGSTLLGSEYLLLSIKSRSMKITDDFRLELKPSCPFHKIDTFRGEQR